MHLTNLTSLACSNPEEEDFKQFPLNLADVHIDKLQAAPVLSHLTRLQKLRLESPRCSDAELLSIRGLPTLKSVTLSYGRRLLEKLVHIPHSSVWGGLVPELQELTIDMWPPAFEEAVAQGIAAVTSLTKLELSIYEHFDDCFDSDADEDYAETNLDLLNAALAPLQQLHELVLIVKPEEKKQFTFPSQLPSTGLTRLQLEAPMALPVLQTLCESAPQLQKLLINEAGFDDWDLELISPRLWCLKVLGLAHTQVSVDGVLRVLQSSRGLLPSIKVLVFSGHDLQDDARLFGAHSHSSDEEGEMRGDRRQRLSWGRSTCERIRSIRPMLAVFFVEGGIQCGI
jgi:hypothetical protein